jgi:hypothetical protein
MRLSDYYPFIQEYGPKAQRVRDEPLTREVYDTLRWDSTEIAYFIYKARTDHLAVLMGRQMTLRVTRGLGGIGDQKYSRYEDLRGLLSEV